MHKTIGGMIVVSILAVSSPVLAHTDEFFESVEAPHGGQLRMTGPFHLELVAKEGDLTVYVPDQNTGSSAPGWEQCAQGIRHLFTHARYRRHRLHETAES
jgi:hypothetical protein